MGAIMTIQSLLRLNGSAQPAMVALMQSEARLIAAAPALLEALRGLLAMAPAVAPAAGLLIGIEERHAKAIDAARAAIAQAEGKS